MFVDDDADFHYPSEQELDRQEAWELGAANPDKAWIGTDRDVWHKNPHYHGPEVPHPEFEGTDEEWAEYQERLKRYEDNYPNILNKAVMNEIPF